MARIIETVWGWDDLPGRTVEGGYPTDQFLEWISNFNSLENDAFEFLEFIMDKWWAGDMGCKIGRKNKEGQKKVYVSTLGWSGNESMIYALRDNFPFWSVHYFSHQRGGHYTFIFE